MRVEPRPPEVEEEITEPSNALRAALALVLVVWATVSWGFTVLAIILAIIFMIFMHELGHYLTAKWAGMKVTEFFIGFGPRLWSFRRGETEYGFKAVPAGAYVRIIGMSNLEEDIPSEDEHRTYRSKPYWRRMSVAVAGSTMHFLMALVLIFVVFAGFGYPKAEPAAWTVGRLTEPSAAFDVGLQLDDRIAAVDGREFADFDAMSDYLRAHPGETVTLTVERDGEVRSIEATLGTENPNTGEKVGFLGIGPTFPVTHERVGPLAAARESVVESFSFGKQAVAGLAHIFSPSGVRGYVDTIVNPDVDGVPGADVTEDRPSSIIGVVHVGDQIAESGIVNLFYLLFGFNIFIGIFNLAPVLPFDGGHVVIATYEKVRSMIAGRRYQADVAKLMPVTYAVVVVLALLFVTTIYLDIAHPLRIN